MPAKDINTISQFEVKQRIDQTQIYSNAYQLPKFFKENLLNENRIIKVFTGENAIIKSFYFNYMKLAIESEDSTHYIELLKQIFISYDYIEEGQLEDKTLTDFQYRKFFKEFLEICENQNSPRFQKLSKRFPIIDKILEKIFKAFVPIALFFPEDDHRQITDFEIVNQILQFLCKKFEEELKIQIPHQCIKFEETGMYIYVQNTQQIYVAYIDEFTSQLELDTNSNSSEKNSFISQENISSRKISPNQSNKSSKQYSSKSDYIKQNLEQSVASDSQSLISYSNSFTKSNSSVQFFQVQDYTSQNGKTSVIRRRSRLSEDSLKNDSLSRNQQKNVKNLLQLPVSVQKIDSQEYSIVQQQPNTEFINSESRDSERANTLINILDSRVNESQNTNQINLVSKLIETNPKHASVIMRRNKANNRSQGQVSKQQSHSFQKDFSEEIIKTPFLKQPQILEQQIIPSKNTSDLINHVAKHALFLMQQIKQLGLQDQEQQNTIKQLCEVQIPYFTDSQTTQKTINISQGHTYKLTIQKIQSRNCNLSRSSLNSPPKKCVDQLKQSFFNCPQKAQLNNLTSATKQNSDYPIFSKQSKPIHNFSHSHPIKRHSQTFQNFMRQMKYKYPFTEQKNFLNLTRQVQSKEYSTDQKNLSQNSEFKQSFPNYLQKKKSQNQSTPSKIEDIQLPEPFLSCAPDSFLQTDPKNLGSSFTTSLVQDEFTKSDILILLQDQYRHKIRTIKNDYKSTIRGNEIRFNCIKNPSNIGTSISKDTFRYDEEINMGRNKNRETSIHIDNENQRNQ